jgi:poly-gamma-glutamate synthesis protein (capsule biosynthesis protein)
MTVTVLAAGDVFPNLAGGMAAFQPLRRLLAAGDIVFGNCEGVYCDRPAKSPSRKHFMGAPRAHGAFLGEVPFHVLTLANNHMLDGGYVGLADTIELLRGQGIAVTGAGEDIDQATSPAIVARGDRRVAFLGFCSVYPVGYEARADRPGIAPLRVRTHYENPDPNFWEPGIEPLISTEPDADDLARFRAAIAAAREHADHVVVACHWGYSSWVEVIQEYELQLARDAIEHGADAVVCHHHHSLRGVELHAGKPIFYGLGALVHHFVDFESSRSARAAGERRFGERSSQRADEGLPLFPYRADAQRTGVAALELHADGTVTAGFVPAIMLPDGSTEPLAPGDDRGEQIAAYLVRLSADSGLETTFSRSEREGFLELRAAAR